VVVKKQSPPRPSAKRSYASALRQEQAQRTRDRIVAAAAELFEASGYARTTMRGIAERAEVATDTVYATFGTKARVLTAVIDARLAPAGQANVLDRPEALAIRDEQDQREQIALFVDDIVAILQRVRPIYEILRTASSVEPEIAAVRAEMDGYRFTNMRHLVEWIAANGPLRVDVDAATEMIWALASPDVARMLLDGRGWTPGHLADWLKDSLNRLLLSDA
jgi:AcrR family transcriptional regulator